MVVYLATFVVAAAGQIQGGVAVVLWSLLLPALLLVKNGCFTVWAHGRLRNEFRTPGVWKPARSFGVSATVAAESPVSPAPVTTGPNSVP